MIVPGRGAVSPEEIADRIEIDELISAYAVAVDDRDWDALRALFADDAVLDYSALDGPRSGVDEAVAWVETGLSGFPVSQHLCVNRQIELEGAVARARCALFNPLVDARGHVHYVGGRYDDRFVKTAEGWRFQERVATSVWSQFS